MNRLLLISLLISSINSNLLASDWSDSFFTDDSPYYLRLKNDGFVQRFRVRKEYCHQIESVSIIFKNPSSRLKTYFKKTSGDQNDQAWPKLYGINEGDYCWFEVLARGTNLNRPDLNKYVIEISSKDGRHYFTGLYDSILPKDRLKKNLDTGKFNWIDLGAMGVTKVDGGGFFFKIWEPVADQVHIKLEGRRTPFRLFEDIGKGHPNRSHAIYIPDVKLNTKYHYLFVKNGAYETFQVKNSGPEANKVDPMGKGLHYEKRGGKHNGYVNPQSVVTQYKKYPWKNDLFRKFYDELQWDNLIVYQLWPLVFNPKLDQGGSYLPGNFQDVLEKIDYISDLGVNTVELLPIHQTRFNASWGFAPDSILLIEKNYGTPHDLKRLVDTFHGKNIRVFLDVVISRVHNFLIRDSGLSSPHGSKYFVKNVHGTLIPKLQNLMVQKWISDSLKSLIRDFHIDGFRFDTIGPIFKNNSVGFVFLQRLNILLKRINPRFHSSVEQLPDDVWVSKPVAEQGLGFSSQWNEKFKNFFAYDLDNYRPNNRTLDLSRLKSALLGFSSHGYYDGEFKFGTPRRTVNYLGSHNFIGNKNPILRIVSDYKGVEWIGAWTAQKEFDRVRPLEEPRNAFNIFRQIHNTFNHSVGRMSYGTLFTKPGGVLFFQGEELANDLNLQNEWSYLDPKNNVPTGNIDVHRFISSHRMPWEYLRPDKNGFLRFLSDYELKQFWGYHRFFKEMIRFRNNHPEINLYDIENVRTTYDDSVVTYKIKGSIEEEFFVVINFGADRRGMWVTFPAGTDFWWEEIYNSSERKYSAASDSFTNIISSLGGRPNFLRLAQSSMAIFRKRMSGYIKRSLYLMGDINNWTANEKFKLVNKSGRGEVYGVQFDVPHDGLYQFKLGTRDWTIEMGKVGVRDKFRNKKGIMGDAGIFGYSPGLPNLKILLKKGSYKFLFNLKTFKFKFIKL